MKTCRYDAVVLGGGAGLIAAVRLRQLTGKRILVLEKAKATGGGFQFARTMRVFKSQWQADRGLEDKTAEFMRGVMDLSLWRVDPELARAAIEGTGQFFDWFCTLEPGIEQEFEVGSYLFDLPDGQKAPAHESNGDGAGRVFMAVMKKKCAELGVDVLTSTPFYDVETEDGRVSAVLAHGPEGQMRIECRNIIIASGRWICSRDIVQRVIPRFNEVYMRPGAQMNPAYTGDAFAAAEKLGAKIDYDSCCLRLMGPHFSSRSRAANQAAGSDFAIGVNLLGRRFVSEPMVPRMDFFDTGHVLLDQPKGVSYWVFDRNTLAAAMERAKDPAAAPPLPLLPPEYPATLAEAEAEICSALGEPELFTAGTAAELARAIGVDEAGLVKTIEEYNEYCRTGMDWTGYKDQKNLVPMTGPFYAVRGWLDTDGSFGGLDVNSRMQVLSPTGEPVPGVWAAGDITGSRYIVAAEIKKQILNDLSWAFSSAFLAANDAARAMKEE